MKTSKNGLDLIKKYEGCRLKAYLDPVGIPTIGYGHTSGVKLGQTITQAEAEAYLQKDVEKSEKAVDKYSSTYHWTQSQFDALVSFAYNIGGIEQLTDHGRRNLREISDKIPAYCNAGGKPLAGLKARREAEKALFDAPVKDTDKPAQTALWDAQAVAALQEALNADGIRDKNGKILKVDGIKGSMTDSAVQKILLKAGLFDTSRGRYGVGSTGQVVKWLQMRLNTVIGDSIIELLERPLEPDGRLGADTRMAVGLLQEIRGLKVDYVVGVKTVTELLKA